MKYNADPNISVTGVVVNYCTPVEIHKAVTTLKKAYPSMKVIIVDGSPDESPGFNTCFRLSNQLHNTIHLPVGRNIGHGPGLVKGIGLVQTELILIFDSDTTLTNPGILEIMIECMSEREEVYGCGAIVVTNGTGVNANTGIQYLHPHFALIDRKTYWKYKPIINHGAPMIYAMNDIHKSGRDILIDFPVSDYVFHQGKVTRRLKPREFHPKNWDKKYR